MFNVLTNCKFIIITTLFFILGLTSCSEGGGGIFGPSEKDRAIELTKQIDEKLSRGLYFEAIELIDSLNTTYPKEIEVRKTTLLSRAKAMEGIIRDSIPLADAEIVSTQLTIDSLSNFFETVHQKGFTPYMVDKSTMNDKGMGTYVQPRVGDQTDPWTLLINIPGKTTIIGYSADIEGVNIKENIINASQRVVHLQNGTSIILTADEIEELGKNISLNPLNNIKLIINTTNGDKTIILTPDIQRSIKRCYMLAEAKEAHRKALVQRELLERKLIVAQNQIANFQK